MESTGSYRYHTVLVSNADWDRAGSGLGAAGSKEDQVALASVPGWLLSCSEGRKQTWQLNEVSNQK